MSNNIEKLSDLIPDNANANEGTERGMRMLKDSFSEFGAGRSILVDKFNRIIAGNKSAQIAEEIGIEDVIIVETDGDALVAVKRTDVDIDSGEGRALAIADNATGEANISWDDSVLQILGEKFGIDGKDWNVDIPDWRKEMYMPNLNPKTSKGEVSGADLENARNKLAGIVDNVKREAKCKTVVCPNCGYEFEIRDYE